MVRFTLGRQLFQRETGADDGGYPRGFHLLCDGRPVGEVYCHTKKEAAVLIGLMNGLAPAKRKRNGSKPV